MDMFKILQWIVKLTQKYGKFEDHVFAHLEVDDLPDFYLLIATLRPIKEKEDEEMVCE